jgi:hypothetical protein
VGGPGTHPPGWVRCHRVPVGVAPGAAVTTDPAKADPGTIRKAFASSIEQNAVHGSDSPESAAYEIPYFFGALEQHAYQRGNG